MSPATGRWSSCCNGFPEFWYGRHEQIAPLVEAGFRVVAPDLRGYTLSSKPEGFSAYTADKLAGDVRGFIRELGAESAMVVGHDWDGSVAWSLARNHPEVVDRLVILNAAHPRKLNEGLKHPRQLPRSWYFFFLPFPNWREHHARARSWRFFKRCLRDARPAYTADELDRYVAASVAARHGDRDGRLLPRRGAARVQAEGRLSRRPPS